MITKIRVLSRQLIFNNVQYKKGDIVSIEGSQDEWPSGIKFGIERKSLEIVGAEEKKSKINEGVNSVLDKPLLNIEDKEIPVAEEGRGYDPRDTPLVAPPYKGHDFVDAIVFDDTTKTVEKLDEPEESDTPKRGRKSKSDE